MGTLKLIILCTSVLVVVSEDYKITPIKTSSGLYFEKIGDVLLSNSKWQFVTSVDYRAYVLFYQYLFNQAGKIQEFCQQLKLDECDTKYGLIRSNLDRIEERDESMANFLGVTKPRVKRFWNEIGNFFSKMGGGIRGVAGNIFGGGSSGKVDLSAYDRQLGDLRRGQREMENQVDLHRTMFMLDSERKQFQIDWLKKTQDDIQYKISSIFEDFHNDSKKKEMEINELKTMYKETEEKIRRQEEIQKKLVGKVEKIESTLIKVDQEIKEMIGKQGSLLELESIRIDFNYLMEQFESEQKILFDVIKNANKGDLDPYILTPLDLVEKLQNIIPHLPEDMAFPFYPNIVNAHNLYKIITPSVYLYNSTVIFILQIPLVHAKTYRIHKITSLPQPLGDNKFAFIQPQEPFLLIDKSYHEYTLMSLDDLNDFCEQIAEGTYLCKQIHQISTSHTNRDCEVAIFKTSKEIPESCDTRLMHLDQPLFLQLRQPNAWIYAVPDTEMLTFNCGHERSTVNLERAGFIEVKGDCIVRTHNIELLPLMEFSSPVQANFSAPLNLSSFIDQSYVEEVDEKSPIRKNIILPFDLEELQESSIPLYKSKTNFAALYYSLLGILPVIICLIIGYLLYRKKINLNKLQTKNTRQSSSQSSIDGEGTGNVQFKLKLKKDDKSVKNIAIHHEDSSDPNSQYVMVRIKTKKNEESSQNNAINNEERVNLLSKNSLIVPQSSMARESQVYLKELRGLLEKKKPTKQTAH